MGQPRRRQVGDEAPGAREQTPVFLAPQRLADAEPGHGLPRAATGRISASVSPPHAVIDVVEVHRRVAMGRLADDLRPHREALVGGSVIDGAVFVAEKAVGRARGRAVRENRRRPVGRETLQPGVDDRMAVVDVVDDRGVDEQRRREGPRVIGRQRTSVVFHVGEDVGTRLQFVQDAFAVVDVVGAGSAAGDERRRQTRFRQRRDRLADARALHGDGGAAFVEIRNVLQMAVIGLQSGEFEPLRRRGETRQRHGRDSVPRAGAAGSYVEINDDPERRRRVRRPRGVRQRREVGGGVADDREVRRLAMQRHEPRDLRRARGGRGDEDAGDPRFGQDFGFAQSGAALACGAGGDLRPRDVRRFVAFRVRAQRLAGAPAMRRHRRDVPFHRIEIEHQRRRMQPPPPAGNADQLRIRRQLRHLSAPSVRRTSLPRVKP